ncbi:phage antirepressor N-terminal domain-containing protein [Glaesserella parasuis]|uniref:phage antirepressor N-terminal domain-containing protein n=1 Tax=Glaesserella parasuis TaxID=738 RepID=UPI001365D9CF|nr:phage antirepressor N-terminal domain-containing protein [Glaesserella parasuis]MDG6351633.1 phage antirepressor N-terminal domain-containing protein [Glaesserella parasuis]MDG6409950.1 phage antirepressor N-terminal domain-containing protein [Glaesserella parasuis]MDO9781433.1 phage antirepressor N-terminal domain-containing protein [Glaesserella parasuis]MDO9828061.1 phage antirepressor N-terminal domain-containing protein [Glaesserella parasuis]MDO9856663.1 phage antirepressor N-terminal
MTTQISTQTISFYGSELITLKVEDVIYTAVKPIVEAMGLDWGGQQQKLSKSGGKFGCRDISMPTNGGLQKMICMPLKKLNGWLFSINPEKVRPDLKDRVIQYQEECFEALYNYWHFGKAERKTTTDERTGLRQAVSALVSKKGLIYSDAYSLIHQRFNVEHIDELTPEQVGMAVEYVHKIYLEGELIIDEPKQNIATPNDEAVRIAKYLVRARAFAKEVEVFHRKLYEDLGIPRYIKNDIAGKAYDIAHEFNVWLDPFIEQALPQLNQQRLARF